MCACVQLVEALYVCLSDPRINAGTGRREETGLSVGWDGIKRTSVESERSELRFRSLPLNVDHRNCFRPAGVLSLCLCTLDGEKGRHTY